MLASEGFELNLQTLQIELQRLVVVAEVLEQIPTGAANQSVIAQFERTEVDF